MTDQTSLDRLIDLAIEAGAAILEIYATDFAVAAKSDASPVTEADARAEAIILAGLARHFPGLPVVAEEAASAGVLPPVADRFLLVDPLDGTKEFISRNGEFTVNIALIENGRPAMGVVYAPALGDIYAGIVGSGAVRAKVEAGRVGPSRPIAVRPAPTEGVAAVGSRSHGSEETQKWLERLKVSSFVSAGSSLKLCLVASGQADVYPRLGRTMEWDIAAGHAVLAAAGGTVTRLDGAPLAYGKRDNNPDGTYANPHFVAWGDTALIDGVQATA